MSKITIEQAKKISPKVLLKIINKAKNHIKKDDVINDLCKEYNVKPDLIDLIPVRFGDLDVSAQTKSGIIILNYKLLCNGDFSKNYSYLIHEIVHVLQQCFRDGPSQGAADGPYLENPYEIDGFQRQLEYIDNQFGKEKAEDYASHLVDYHDISPKQKEEKKEELLENVEE